MSKLNRAAKNLARASKHLTLQTVPNPPAGATTATAAAPARSLNYQTGPRTAAGKAVSSQNARTHGLTGQTVHIPDHQRAEYDALQDSLHNQINPATPIEQDLFDRYLRASWNLRRIDELESRLLGNPGFLDDEVLMKQFDRFQRYRAANERSLYRALKEIQPLQTNRTQRADVVKDLPSDAPDLLRICDFAKRKQIHRGVRRPDPALLQFERDMDLCEADFKHNMATLNAHELR